MSYASTIQKPNAYFDHLYHMTHIDNLSSILLYGLLPHGNVHQKTDISDRDVNKRRGRNVTSFVHSFFISIQKILCFMYEATYLNTLLSYK